MAKPNRVEMLARLVDALIPNLRWYAAADFAVLRDAMARLELFISREEQRRRDDARAGPGVGEPTNPA